MINNLITFKGEINKKLPNSMFLVFFPLLNKRIVCYLCGKLRIKYIKLFVGDRVIVEFYKTHLLKGRIISKYNENKSID